MAAPSIAAYLELNRWDTMHLTTKQDIATSRNATMVTLKLQRNRVMEDIPFTLIYMLVKISECFESCKQVKFATRPRPWYDTLCCFPL